MKRSRAIGSVRSAERQQPAGRNPGAHVGFGPGIALLLALAASPAAAAEPGTGEELYERFDCSGCHEVAMVPGMLVVPLENLSASFTEDGLMAFLASPPEAMPVFEMSDAERRALARYLRKRHP